MQKDVYHNPKKICTDAPHMVFRRKPRIFGVKKMLRHFAHKPSAKKQVRVGPFLMPIGFAAAALLVSVQGAAAEIVKLDSFSVLRNGSTFFDDTFSEGVTLTSPVSSSGLDLSNGFPASYTVNGKITEVGGFAQLNSSVGKIFVEPSPLPVIDENTATLRTGALTRATTFSTAAIFNLSVPAVQNAFYGVQLVGSSGSNIGDIVELRVKDTSGGPQIVFENVDLATASETMIGDASLETGHQQILLELSHPTLNSDVIDASFAYLDGGVEGALTTLGPTSSVFGTDTFAVPGFLAVDPVPEPATLSLFAVGLFGIGFAMRRARLR